MYLQDMLYKLDLSEADCLVSNASPPCIYLRATGEVPQHL